MFSRYRSAQVHTLASWSSKLMSVKNNNKGSFEFLQPFSSTRNIKEWICLDNTPKKCPHNFVLVLIQGKYPKILFQLSSCVISCSSPPKNQWEEKLCLFTDANLKLLVIWLLPYFYQIRNRLHTLNL